MWYKLTIPNHGLFMTYDIHGLFMTLFYPQENHSDHSDFELLFPVVPTPWLWAPGKLPWRPWRTVSLWEYSHPPTKLVKYHEILLTYWWNMGERCMFYLFGGHFLTKIIAPTHPAWHLDRLAWVSWMSPPYGLPTEISKAKRPRADCFGGNAWAAVFPARVSAKRQLLKP